MTIVVIGALRVNIHKSYLPSNILDNASVSQGGFYYQFYYAFDISLSGIEPILSIQQCVWCVWVERGRVSR